MDLNELLVFAKVVQAGSFIGAARELDMPKSTVSRKVSELEARLGARLLHRTTRKLSLTDVGEQYFLHAERVVAVAADAERAVTRLSDVPRGRLRVTTPLNFRFMAPLTATFLKRYPEVQLEMVSTDRLVDLVADGFDLAVRAGHLADSSAIARDLGTLTSYVVASPTFLRKFGAPTSPEDLARFQCLVFGAGAARTTWSLTRDTKSVAVKVTPRLIVNDFDFLEEAALAHLGLALLPAFHCVELLRSKRLKRVLPAWSSTETPLHAVYPSTRHLSPSVRAFVDHLRDQMRPPPWERARRSR